MDEGVTKICPNCKREIPVDNFTIHTVHCSRNIRVCPVCKEPVLQSELQEHHEAMHKLLPCKQCGEKVCGTDLEDHIRDSCANTNKSCRYCELEVPRSELPHHEGYCGVRTEQCPDCHEWVMIKYRHLHLDSNHGFLRLDDDPTPQPKKEPPKPANILKPSLKLSNVNLPSTSTNNGARPTITNGIRNINENRARVEIRQQNPVPNLAIANGSRNINENRARVEIRQQNPVPNLAIANGSRNINENRARVEIRQQNPVPNLAIANGSRNINENRPRVEIRQPGFGVAIAGGSGTRPSTSTDRSWRTHVTNNTFKPLVKKLNENPLINKNMMLADKIARSRMPPAGALKKRAAPQPPYPVSCDRPPPPSPARPPPPLPGPDFFLDLDNVIEPDQPYYSALEREREREEEDNYGMSPGLDLVRRIQKQRAREERENVENNYARLQGPMWGPAFTDNGHVLDNSEEVNARRRQEFRNLKPMSPEEFMDRFNELQLERNEDEDEASGGDRSQASRGDRFNEIKSSLRELRRGLNEVTAPYNSNAALNNVVRPDPRSELDSDDDEVRLPCEFCGHAVPANSLVQHQTGCRPDLAQFRPRSGSPSRWNRVRVVPEPAPVSPDEPVIPCEFCGESLPVYLISEHQERCGQEESLLYPD